MMVVDRIEACADGRIRPVDPHQRRVVIVHRTGMGADAAAVSRAFQSHPEAGAATGYQMPYTIVIRRDGVAEQALRIGDAGPHARAWNLTGIGVAVVGDPRHEPLPPVQYTSLVAVCATLAGWLGGAVTVRGHDELRRASGDPQKQCPGEYLPMQRLREDVSRAAQLACEAAGFVF
jgi:hypothetical protein